MYIAQCAKGLGTKSKGRRKFRANLKRTIILEHFQNPKNKGLIKDDSYKFINMNNESCIDEINLMVKINNNKI